MNRRTILAGLAGSVVGAMVCARQARSRVPMDRSELTTLWARCKSADDAAHLMRIVPASWGPLPWTFAGPYRDLDGVERYARVEVYAVLDEGTGGVRFLTVAARGFGSEAATKIRGRSFRKA